VVNGCGRTVFELQTKQTKLQTKQDAFAVSNASFEKNDGNKLDDEHKIDNEEVQTDYFANHDEPNQEVVNQEVANRNQEMANRNQEVANRNKEVEEEEE